MKKTFIGMLMLFLISLSTHTWAANFSNPIDGIFSGVSGDTITIEVPSLVSKSPVTNENQNGDLSFTINPNTAYSNFNQLTDLKYGDAVRIEYKEGVNKDNQMVAVTITKLEAGTVVNPGYAPNTATTVTVPENQTVTTTTTTRVNSQ